jgi:hypothetical protein
MLARNCPSAGTPAQVRLAEQMSFALPKSVVIGLAIGADAKPRNLMVVQSGGDSVDKSALSHLTRWEFRPAIWDGKPVDREMHVDFPSSLAAHGADNCSAVGPVVCTH